MILRHNIAKVGLRSHSYYPLAVFFLYILNLQNELLFVTKNR